MRYRDPRRKKGGYYDLGPVQIPPLPQPIVMTDRDDGTLYLISFNLTEPSVDNLGHIAINSDVSLRNIEGVKTFAADDGPKLGPDGEWTLLIRGGRLGIEFADNPMVVTDRDDAPTFARRRGSRTVRQLIVYPDQSRDGEEILAFRTEDFIYG